MSSWDAVTMENPGSPVYRVMDKGPRTRSKSREEKKAELIAHFQEEKKKAAIRIQKHFRGMIVRNPTGMPLNTWLSLVAGPLEDEEKPKTINERWLEEPIITQVESADNLCHPVGWNSTNHYSDMGWQWCGQSCPCCRAKAGDTLGACEICLGKALSL